MTVNTGYSTGAIAQHWLTAILLLAGFTIGFVMGDFDPSPFKLQLVQSHKWIGVTVSLLTVARLTWRRMQPPPASPLAPGWQRSVASITHAALYLLLFAAPLSGWLMSSAKGFQTVYFGVLPIPDLLAKNTALGETLAEVHEVLVFTLLWLIGLHVLAALKHHFFDRDGVLGRMLPGRE